MLRTLGRHFCTMFSDDTDRKLRDVPPGIARDFDSKSQASEREFFQSSLEPCVQAVQLLTRERKETQRRSKRLEVRRVLRGKYAWDEWKFLFLGKRSETTGNYHPSFSTRHTVNIFKKIKSYYFIYYLINNIQLYICIYLISEINMNLMIV